MVDHIMVMVKELIDINEMQQSLIEELQRSVSELQKTVKLILSGQEYAVIRGKVRDMAEFDQPVDRALPEGLIK